MDFRLSWIEDNRGLKTTVNCSNGEFQTIMDFRQFWISDHRNCSNGEFQTNMDFRLSWISERRGLQTIVDFRPLHISDNPGFQTKVDCKQSYISDNIFICLKWLEGSQLWYYKLPAITEHTHVKSAEVIPLITV